MALALHGAPEHFRPVQNESPDSVSSIAGNESAPIVLPLTEIGKPEKWLLTLHPTHLALAEPGQGQPYIILRDQVMRTATLVERMGAFVLQKPRKVTFNLTSEGTATLADWIGKPIMAAVYLKRRYGWILPIAVLWVLGSLPIKGNPDAGVEGVPFDPIGLILGLTLIVSWALAKWRPHPALFLVDSLWFLAMAGHLVVGVVNGRSKLWLILVALLVWMMVTGLKHFIRFKGTKVTRWDG
ncbi:MAG: hypothetical protein ACK4UN_19525 [Limisphaerales bacterium]